MRKAAVHQASIRRADKAGRRAYLFRAAHLPTASNLYRRCRVSGSTTGRPLRRIPRRGHLERQSTSQRLVLPSRKPWTIARRRVGMRARSKFHFEMAVYQWSSAITGWRRRGLPMNMRLRSRRYRAAVHLTRTATCITQPAAFPLKCRSRSTPCKPASDCGPSAALGKTLNGLIGLALTDEDKRFRKTT